ncbi:hypothetical protein DPMN_133853 [Dreissena polymorpha]|uniref:Uncharacterized protein n=1 Tax=Dreissena polymorpha TaxID=45954 RepID=A0A9D4JDA4_DREPO|nr:hypothetical protein DPMN_133853 [Dreissena polymorpha]
MTLRDFRKELPVSVQEYNTMMTKTIISCDVSVHHTLPCSNFGSPLPTDDEQEEEEEDTGGWGLAELGNKRAYGSIPIYAIVPRELRVNTSDWLTDDVQHVSVAASKILLRKVDMEMRKAGLIRDHPRTIKRIMLSDKVENYKILDKTNALLDKEAVMRRRAASRAEAASPKIDEDDKF